MENDKICQSCGMPLSKDSNGGGTNKDNSISDLYCGYCFVNGEFVDGCKTVQDKIDKNVSIAVGMIGMPEELARKMAEEVLPNLSRWK